MGFTPEDYADDYVECWPENWSAFRVFSSVASQWRFSMGGVAALDYSVLFLRMEKLRLPDDEWEQMFSDVKELEAGALSVFRRNNS
jgi:hypothetical protein